MSNLNNDEIERKLILFRQIKEICNKPPVPDDDIYFERKPWKDIAFITPGICMGTAWETEEYVVNYASYSDLEKIYQYCKNEQKQEGKK